MSLNDYLDRHQVQMTYKQYSMLLILVILLQFLAIFMTAVLILHTINWYFNRKIKKLSKSKIPVGRKFNEEENKLDSDQDETDDAMELERLTTVDYNTINKTIQSPETISKIKSEKYIKFTHTNTTEQASHYIILKLIMVAFEAMSLGTILTSLDVFASFRYIETTGWFYMLKYSLWLCLVT